ncbi:hypothetical protein GR239_29270 [Rhizobium leguminosarum]|nr:hypothetical protein [Rhizobium ruizarguesonis]NEI16587.1 hypothetical protein [Rhizobium ruizarguesonis]NEJ01775.1 hypothetical protein [Rhizobium ruizarguesonis]NEJ32421.1 hypothetical protein [Rhizobium ruizarguesonis]NEJ38886.1 hypothetical protein [Rhizobium ruizarguesonis]
MPPTPLRRIFPPHWRGCLRAYLTATLTAIVNGHRQSQIEGLLPWNCLAR